VAPSSARQLALLCVRGWWCRVLFAHQHAVPSPPRMPDSGVPATRPMPAASASLGQFAGIERERCDPGRQNWPFTTAVKPDQEAQAQPKAFLRAHHRGPHWSPSPRIASLVRVSRREHLEGTTPFARKLDQPQPKTGFCVGILIPAEASAEQSEESGKLEAHCWINFRPIQAAVSGCTSRGVLLDSPGRQKPWGSSHTTPPAGGQGTGQPQGGAGLRPWPCIHTYESGTSSSGPLLRRSRLQLQRCGSSPRLAGCADLNLWPLH